MKASSETNGEIKLKHKMRKYMEGLSSLLECCLYYNKYLLAPAIVCYEELASRLECRQQLPEEFLLALDVQDCVAAAGGELRWSY